MYSKVNDQILSYTTNGRKDCFRCGKENCNLKCANCKVARYCSKECQKLHWKHHKKVCVIDGETNVPKRERKLFQKFDHDCRHGGREPEYIAGIGGNAH